MSAKSTARRAATVFIAAVAVVAVLTPSVTGAAAAQIGAPSGSEVLDDVVERYESAETLSGRLVVTTTNETTSVASNVSVAYADPDSWRVVVDRGNETVRSGSNGSVSWTVGPDGAAVWDAEAFTPSPTGRVPGAGTAVSWAVPVDVDAANVSADLVGSATVDGTDAYELRVTPTDGDGDPVTLFVATDDSRVLRAVATDGPRRTVADVSAVFFDPSVDSSTFRPPTDRLEAASFDRYESFAETQAGTDLELPRLTGGEFRDATVAVRDGETLVAQRYLFDGENATLVSTTATEPFARNGANASTVDIDGREASVTESDGRSIVAWTADGVTTAVIVSGTPDRAVEAARQVRYPDG